MQLLGLGIIRKTLLFFGKISLQYEYLPTLSLRQMFQIVRLWLAVEFSKWWDAALRSACTVIEKLIFSELHWRIGLEFSHFIYITKKNILAISFFNIDKHLKQLNHAKFQFLTWRNLPFFVLCTASKIYCLIFQVNAPILLQSNTLPDNYPENPILACSKNVTF